MPRDLGDLTTREPDQALDAFADWTLYGVFDGAFAKGPDVGVGIALDETDREKRMQYWSGPFVVSGSAATVKQITRSEFPSGYGLEFSFASSAAAEDVYIEQTFPLAGSFYRIAGGILRVSGDRPTGTGLSIETVLEYMGVDGTIYNTDTQSTTASAVFLALSDQAAPTPDPRVRKVRLRIHVKRTLGAAATPGTVRLSDVRFDRTVLSHSYADIQSNFPDPLVLSNSFAGLNVAYQGSSLVAVSAEDGAGAPAGYSALWTILPLALSMIAAPGTPDSGSYVVYPKSDGKLYGINDVGTERRLDLVAGTDVEAWDADLDAIAALSTTGILARTGANTWALRTWSAPAAGITITNPGGVAGNPTLALADDLAGLEAITGTGIVARTASNTYATRTWSAPAAGITISNAGGVAGNPALALADDLDALESLATTGLAVRSGTSTWLTRALTAPAAGFTITNAGGISGSPTFVLADDLSGLEGLSGTGLAVRTGTGTWTTRSLTFGGSGLAISNADGVAGAPSYALANDVAAIEALTGTGYPFRLGVDNWAIYALPDLQTFSATSGTWTKPTGATWVYAITIGAGGGGGSARRGAAGTSRGGGGGGGGGAITEAWYVASSLAGTVSVTAGTGGAGGPSTTTNDTNGTTGTDGGDSSFGTSLKSSGGKGGVQGTSAGGGVGGAGGSTFGERPGSAGGAGGAGGVGAAGTSSLFAAGAPGGGGGTGIGTGDGSGANGGDGGTHVKLQTAAGTGGIVAGAVAPTASSTPSWWCGTGGGGGANAANCRAGAAGGRGAGGGGSSGTLNGTATGAGGDGGSGYVLVIST
jgi:hypothetical protein